MDSIGQGSSSSTSVVRGDCQSDNPPWRPALGVNPTCLGRGHGADRVHQPRSLGVRAEARARNPIGRGRCRYGLRSTTSCAHARCWPPIERCGPRDARNSLSLNQRTGSPQLSGERDAEHRREPRRSRPPDRAMPAESAHPAATPGKLTPSIRPPQTTPPRGSAPRGGLDRCLQRAGSPVGSWKRTLGPPTMSTHPAAALPLTRRRRRSRWMLGPGCSRRA